jgi:hypothetical protein
MRRTLLIVSLALILSSCATQPIPNAYNPPGFFMGLVHGFISLFSLIGSIFWDIRVYAFPNSGGWYDAGFVLGAALFYGGIGRGESKAEEYYLLGYEEGKKAAKSGEDDDD